MYLGVGSGHVFVGAAANDPVTKLPSKAQVVVGGVGLGGAYLAGDLAPCVTESKVDPPTAEPKGPACEGGYSLPRPPARSDFWA